MCCVRCALVKQLLAQTEIRLRDWDDHDEHGALADGLCQHQPTFVAMNK